MLSVYVHIPYCLQRCRYCDFTTFEQSEILSPEKYVAQVRAEIQSRHQRWTDRTISTIYFGGGTPSLLKPELIISILGELANVGFHWTSEAELTIEINPATMDEGNLDAYLSAGMNRFSVGAQSFNDSHLQACGRKHSAEETRATLRILQRRQLNYSFDLLFALPNQSLSEVQQDLEEVSLFRPPHLSAYCLTVPESHPMSRGRAPEDDQIKMFECIETELLKIGVEKYEISNFAKPGFESRHNMVYWADQNFWGIGLSAHSYDRESGAFGERFWNTKDLREYAVQARASVLPQIQAEKLQQHEAMTDFCHMFLRTRRGLDKAALQYKFGESADKLVLPQLQKLTEQGLIHSNSNHFCLTKEGEMVSNLVFERLTFLPTRTRLTRENSATY